MTDAPAVNVALGCDFSTKAVHLALVSATAVEAMRVVPLRPREPSLSIGPLSVALAELCRLHPTTLVIERPFVNVRKDRGTDYLTPILLGRVWGMVETLALQEGYRVLCMTANEWRSMAGVTRLQSRKDAKREAVRLVALEYGYAARDDNEAEAILMGRVGLALHRRAVLVEATS